MSAVELTFKPVKGDERVAVISLNRPEAANSFNDAVIDEMVAHLETVRGTKNVRACVLRGKGKHFSAGADLGWMKAAAKLGFDENTKDAQSLTRLFEALSTLPIPTLGVITGSAFGGAVGLTACCDVALASEKARFALSEVKLGLLPAVILPYLARKMRPGQLRRLALTGKIFSAQEAYEYGLVERVAGEENLEQAIREELDLLLAGSPEAQAAVKALHSKIVTDSLKQGPHTAEAIAKARTSQAGQAGLQSFFDKTAAPWAANLGADWRLD